MTAITPLPWATDFDSLIENLGIPHRAKKAYWTLLSAGASAVPALKKGLAHSDPKVRVAVCAILDHSLEEECIPDLRANLGQRTKPCGPGRSTRSRAIDARRGRAGRVRATRSHSRST